MKIKNNIIITVYTGLCFLVMIQCTDSPTAGNGSQTPNSAIGVLYNPDGSRAGNAKVIAIPADHNPISEFTNRITAIDSTFTNDSGEYSFDSLPEDYYNIFGEGDSGLSYNDSFFVFEDTINVFPDDTLGSPGTLRGVVRLQPGDDSRTVIILVFGTKTWEAPFDTIGNFALANMAAGTYHVRFLTTLSNYDPLDMNLVIKAGVDSTISDTIRLTYTGIPLPEGLTASYDTLNGVVNLSWDSLDFSRLEGYIVFRNDISSTIPENISGNKALKDTFYIDTVFTNLLDTNSYVFEYRLKSQDTNAVMSGQYSIPVEVSAVSPTKVRTFLNFSSINTVNDTATINDTIKIILNFSNATRINDSLFWAIGHLDSIEKEVDLSSLSGTDTLECAWDIAGLKKIYVKVIDNGGSIWVDSILIKILQDLPVANAGNDTTVGRNDTINLRGSQSIDGYGTIVKYEWDIGNTGSFIEVSNGDTNIVIDTFNFEGIYCILKVTDDDSGSDLDTLIATIGAVKLAIDSANFAPREGHKSVVYDGKMWIIAGKVDSDYSNDVWYSADGKNWIQAVDSAAFKPISGHTSVVFNNKMWIIGGNGSDTVWSSSDGIIWTKESSGVFAQRMGHTSVLFDNKMWIIGGTWSGNHKNDVWSSSDGITWTEATSSAAFPPRSGHASVVFDNKMWVIGGRDAPSSMNDVWHSTDGVNWIQATTSAAFIDRLEHTSIVFDNKMWVIGGRRFFADTATLNDIWYSEDGINWIEAIESAPFSPRDSHASVIFDEKIWIIGGGMKANVKKNDVWYLY